MKRHDSDDSPVAAKLQRFELLKKRYINVHIIINYYYYSGKETKRVQ